MQETILYQDSSIFVSNTRLVLNGVTYAIRNLTSVKVGTQNKTQNFGLFLIVVGVGLAFVLFQLGVSGFLIRNLFTFVLATAIFSTPGALVFWKAKPEYILIVIAGGTEITGLITKDQQRIEAISGAINQAIANSH